MYLFKIDTWITNNFRNNFNDVFILRNDFEDRKFAFLKSTV